MAAADDRTIDELVTFLNEFGADEVEHTQRSLLAHLVDTHDILREWDCAGYLCRAGLFHSVYGTEMFQQTTIPTGERARVREAIGDEAERIAWLYCVLVRDSIYESGDSVTSREDGSRIPITEQELADLWTLDLANRLELLRRHPLTPEQQAADRELYERGTRFYPAAGLAAMRRQYGDA